MLRFYADKFIAVFNMLGLLESLLSTPESFFGSPVNLPVLIDNIERLSKQLSEMKLSVSLKQAQRILAFTKSPDLDKSAGTVTIMRQYCAELRGRIEDELEGKYIYAVLENVDLLASDGSLFGEAVAQKFPTLAEDIELAGKCLALGQPTASVFHLMRAMEGAVQELSESINISNPEREWGKLLSDIHAKIEAMPKGDSRNNWSQVHANLYHVKQAWRNDTMHPKQTYTPEQAREVFDAMKAFMSHLSGLI